MQNPIEKIKKLFAMAKDASSPNEAAIAARQARALMDKFQIDELDLTTTSTNDFGEDLFTTGKTVPRWISVIGLAVARYNDTRASIAHTEGKAAIRFKGFLTDAVCSAEMLKYLRDVGLKLGAKVEGSRATKNAFRNGFATGVRQQVNELIKERTQVKTSAGTSLVVVKDQLVTQQFGIQRTSTSRANGSGSVAFSRGVEAGRNVNLGRQVGSSAGASRYLQG